MIALAVLLVWWIAAELVAWDMGPLVRGKSIAQCEGYGRELSQRYGRWMLLVLLFMLPFLMRVWIVGAFR